MGMCRDCCPALAPGTRRRSDSLYGTATVILNYPNGATGNFFYAGPHPRRGHFDINATFALGGANYGGLTFNNGTLQYNATLPDGRSGTALDISGARRDLGGQRDH